MALVFAIVGMLVVVGAFWIAAGRLNVDLPDATHDLRPDQRAGEPSFDVVMRGYRMDEVDATIADLQAQIERLKGTPKK
jgi:hypothetical protein